MTTVESTSMLPIDEYDSSSSSSSSSSSASPPFLSESFADQITQNNKPVNGANNEDATKKKKRRKGMKFERWITSNYTFAAIFVATIGIILLVHRMRLWP